MPLTPSKIPDSDIIRQTRTVVNGNADLLVVEGVPTDTGFSLETEGGDTIDVDLTQSFLTRAEAQQLASVGIASEDNSGRLKISTETQARQGNDDTTAMTPYKVALAFLARNLPFFNFDDAAPGKQVVVDSVDPDTGSVTLKVVNAIVATLNAVVQNGRAAFGTIFLDEGTTQQGGLPGLVLRVKDSLSNYFELVSLKAIDASSAAIFFKALARLVFEATQVQVLSDLKVSDWLTAKSGAFKEVEEVGQTEFLFAAVYDAQYGYVLKRIKYKAGGGGFVYDLTTPIQYHDATIGSNESVRGNDWQVVARENIGPGQWQDHVISRQQLGQYALAGLTSDELRDKLAGASEVVGDARKPVAFYCRPMPTPAQTTQAYNVNASMFGIPQAHNLQTSGANIMAILLNANGQFEQNVIITYPDAGHFLLTPVSANMTDWTGKLRLDKTVTS